MKLKLRYSEMSALARIVEFVSEGLPNTTMHQRLLKAMMERLNYDLRVRVFIYKKEYRVTWHPERAMAFYCVFEGLNIAFGPFENNLLRRIMDDIRKAYTPIHIFSNFKYLLR